MAGKLTEPMIITDYNQKMICVLPPGFYFDDDRWDQIWQRYDEKGETLTSIDLLEMYPDEEALKSLQPDEQTLADMIPASVTEAIKKRS